MMIRVFFCGPTSESGGVANHTLHLTNILSTMNIKIIWHKFSGSIYSRMFNRTFGMFIQSIKFKNEFDIIHVQCSAGLGSMSAAITGVVVSYIFNKKLFFTYHSSNILHPFLFKLVLLKAQRVILVSQLQKNILITKFPESVRKIVVISNGFDRAIFYVKNRSECRSNLGLPDKKIILLTIGNLLDVKGHRFLIDAMNLIRSKRDDLLCIIIGDGILKSKLNNQIKKLKLENNIFLIGQKPHDEISLWMNACDLFILPSLTEGNPTVMFEALGCGKPFVGTKVGGVPEIITSDKYGLLVEPANSNDLAEKIMLALDRDWNHEAISDYAAQFTWESIANHIRDIYHLS